MPEPAIATSKPLHIKGVRMVWPRLLAYRLDRLLVIEGRDLLMSFSIEDDKPRMRELRPLGYRPASMSLSLSRRFVLLGNEVENWYELRDAQTLEAFTTFSEPERFPCAFASLEDMDVLVVARRPGVLELVSLPDGDVLGRSTRPTGRPFVVANVVTVGGGQSVALVGHPYLGLYSSHVLVETKALESADGLALKAELDRAVSARGDLDLAVGPCGWDDMLVYSGNPGPRAAPGSERGGLAVRKLDTGEAVEELGCAMALGPRSPLMGTSLVVAMAVDDGVRLQPRRGFDAEPRLIAARAVSFDPDAGRLALATPESTVELVELART
jgi:hypothetical protein